MTASPLAVAMLEVQRAMPAIEPNSTNPHFKNKYVSLDHLLATALPILHKNGIVLSQLPVSEDGRPALLTVITHAESGDKLTFTTPMVLDRENSQGLGSAITYTRRYALAAALGISSEKDDDGNAASGQVKQRKKPVEETSASRRAKLEARLEELAFEADAARDLASGSSFAEVVKRLGDNPDEEKLVAVGIDLADWIAEGCPCPFTEYAPVKF